MSKTLTPDALRERADRLAEIAIEMRELLDEARNLVRDTPVESRATAYWIAHIAMSLDDDHEYVVRGGGTIARCVDSLREAAHPTIDDADEPEPPHNI